MRFGGNFDVIKNVGSFDNIFHDIRVHQSVGVFHEVWYTQDLEIQFGLGEMSILDVVNV